MDEKFWEDIKIPFQENDDNFQFVNPVAVAQKFAKASGILSFLSKQAEVLTEQIATYTIRLEEARRKLRGLRREVLSKHYKEISKSAGSEVQEAFIYNKATEDGCVTELLEIEAEIESLTGMIASRQPRLDQFRARQKTLIQNMEWAEQYLNFEKHVTRVER